MLTAEGGAAPPSACRSEIVEIVDLLLDRLAGLRRLGFPATHVHSVSTILWYSLASGILGPSTKFGSLMPKS